MTTHTTTHKRFRVSQTQQNQWIGTKVNDPYRVTKEAWLHKQSGFFVFAQTLASRAVLPKNRQQRQDVRHGHRPVIVEVCLASHVTTKLRQEKQHVGHV